MLWEDIFYGVKPSCSKQCSTFVAMKCICLKPAVSTKESDVALHTTT